MIIRSWRMPKRNKIEPPRSNSAEEPYTPMRQSYVEHRVELVEMGFEDAGFFELSHAELRKYEDDHLVEALRFSTAEDARRYYYAKGQR